MSKHIPLSQGRFAIVDDEDYEMLSSIGKWSLNAGYAARTQRSKETDGKQKFISMHRLILNAPKEYIVDHINGNKLDNRKSNLRLCTDSQNLKNQGKRKANTSGYKGVFWHIRQNRWIAKLYSNKKCIYLGMYDCPIEAAKAYNAGALKHHGEFANLNQIPE